MHACTCVNGLLMCQWQAKARMAAVRAAAPPRTYGEGSPSSRPETLALMKQKLAMLKEKVMADTTSAEEAASIPSLVKMIEDMSKKEEKTGSKATGAAKVVKANLSARLIVNVPMEAGMFLQKTAAFYSDNHPVNAPAGVAVNEIVEKFTSDQPTLAAMFMDPLDPLKLVTAGQGGLTSLWRSHEEGKSEMTINGVHSAHRDLKQRHKHIAQDLYLVPVSLLAAATSTVLSGLVVRSPTKAPAPAPGAPAAASASASGPARKSRTTWLHLFQKEHATGKWPQFDASGKDADEATKNAFQKQAKEYNSTADSAAMPALAKEPEAVSKPSTTTQDPPLQAPPGTSAFSATDQKKVKRMLSFLEKTKEPSCGWQHIIVRVETYLSNSDPARFTRDTNTVTSILDVTNDRLKRVLEMVRAERQEEAKKRRQKQREEKKEAAEQAQFEALMKQSDADFRVLAESNKRRQQEQGAASGHAMGLRDRAKRAKKDSTKGMAHEDAAAVHVTPTAGDDDDETYRPHVHSGSSE